MPLRTAALVAFLIFPGWAAAGILDRGALDRWERLFLPPMLGTVLVSLGALSLASLNGLRFPNLLLLVLLPSLVLCVAARRAGNGLPRGGKKPLLAALLVVIFVLLVISPPSRIVYGWSDVGIYPNIAAQMARNGGIAIKDSLVPKVAPENRELVFRPNEDPEVPMEAYQNKALFITDFRKGEVRPQFLYLWPSLMAVFGFFLGLENMFWAVTWVSLLTLLGLFLVARRWIGAAWAYVTAFLMLISPLFLFFSRYTSSEMMNAALLMAAVLCHSAYLEAQRADASREALGMAAASSLFLWAGFLCRIDFFLVLLPVLVLYLCKRLFGRFDTADWVFFLACVLGGALCAFVDYLLSKPYFMRVFLAYRENTCSLWGFPGILALLAYSALFITGRRFARRCKPLLERFLHRCRYVLSALLCAGLGAYVLYLGLVRPGEPQTFASYGEINAIVGPTYSNETLLRWAWYFSWAGVIALFLGYALYLCLEKGFSQRLFAAVGLIFSIVYSLSLRCTPTHILTMRRLVPVVLPLGLIMTVYALKTVFSRFARPAAPKSLRRLGKSLAVAFVVYLAAYFIFVAQPIFGLREGGNQYEMFREMAGYVPEDGVMIMDLSAGDICGVPLKCFFDVENLWLVDNFSLGREEFLSLLGDLDFPETPVYILWRPGSNIVPVPRQESLRYHLLGKIFWREEMLEQSFVSRPRKRIYHLEAFEIYKVEKVR